MCAYVASVTHVRLTIVVKFDRQLAIGIVDEADNGSVRTRDCVGKNGSQPRDRLLSGGVWWVRGKGIRSCGRNLF